MQAAIDACLSVRATLARSSSAKSSYAMGVVDNCISRIRAAAFPGVPTTPVEPAAHVVQISMLGVNSPPGKMIQSLCDLPVGTKLYLGPDAAPEANTQEQQKVLAALVDLARIVDRAVEDWGESFADGSSEVKFHKEEAEKLHEILDYFDILSDGDDDNVIESGPMKAARILLGPPNAQAIQDAAAAALYRWLRDHGRENGWSVEQETKGWIHTYSSDTLDAGIAAAMEGKQGSATRWPPGAPSIAERGETLGEGLPDWPDWCSSFRERLAYQQGIADARAQRSAGTVAVEEYRQLVAQCIKLGEQLVSKKVKPRG